MKVEIDKKSGFCFGVENAILKAEEALASGKEIYCLGDIVHNEEEVGRLRKMGLKTIDKLAYYRLHDCTVLIRAHGEPPEVYEYAAKNNIDIIEGTCPVVLNLQQKIRKVAENNPDKQVVIFGKEQHPEVIGLTGQTKGKAKIIRTSEEISEIPPKADISLFAQTTMDKAEYAKIQQLLKEHINSGQCSNLSITQSICGQVSNRAPWLEKFAVQHNAIVFVGGKKSSNSKVLFEHCKKANNNSYFVSGKEEAVQLKLRNVDSIGVCGATSTPRWLMEQVAAVFITE